MIRVHSQAHPYDVHLGHGVLVGLGEALANHTRVAVVHPEALPRFAEIVEAATDVEVTRIPVPDAESAKTPDVLVHCWNALADAGFTRSDVVVGIGGGTTTDLAGFVAASWLRGVAYVSVPTTVLAMVDAAVGGKTGINLAAGKNLVGAFHEPDAVFCDFSLLETLPEVDTRAGMAEVVKCGFIKDSAILELAQRSDRLDVGSTTFAELVSRAVQVKADVVAADFRESTSVGDAVGREALNYGHTLGHAIEKLSGYSWRHGEAIAVGMRWMARVSRETLGLDRGVVALHDELFDSLGLPGGYDAAWADLRHTMSLDKKSRAGSLRLVGLRDVGVPSILTDPDEGLLERYHDQLTR